MKNKFPAVRIKQFITNPRYIFFWLGRLVWFKRSSFSYRGKYTVVIQLSPQQTLDELLTKNRSIIRFGDGEFGLLSGAGIFPPDSDWSQRYSNELKETIQRQLQLNDSRILVAVPPISHLRYQIGDVPVMDVIPSMHTEARMFLWRYMNPQITYGDWSVFMPHFHHDLKWDKVAECVRNKTVVIVTGGIEKLSEIKIGARTLFVECGKHDAFERRHSILDAIDVAIDEHQLDSQDTLFWVSLGCTAGVVVEHLVGRGFVAWDTGHIFRFADKEIHRELAQSS